MTKQETLNEFCDYFSYHDTKLQGETKREFLERKQKEWALECVRQQLLRKKITEVREEETNLDI